MLLRLILPFFLLLDCQPVAHADHIEEVPQDFIGFLDVSDRYGGYEGWIQAVSGDEDNAQTYSVIEAIRPVSGSDQDIEKPIMANSFSTLEVGYEEPSILVYRRFSSWVQVRINDAYVWIETESSDRFVPYESEIHGDRLAFLLSKFVTISDSPGGPTRGIIIEPEMQGVNTSAPEFYAPDIEVIGRAVFYDFEAGYNDALYNRYGTSNPGQTWFRVRILSKANCIGVEAPEQEPLAEGWIPANDDTGKITVWFSSRGC